MKLIDITKDYKPISAFRREANAKHDANLIYSSEKYEIEFDFKSSVFYGPSFYSASVKDKQGKDIWDGGKAIFLETFFDTDFVSDEFDRLILTRVNSTDSPKHMQILLVDLKTGKEEVLTEEDDFLKAGHLLSFDAIYFNTFQSKVCIDFTHDRKFDLQAIFSNYFNGIIAWGACSVKNCIVVITKAEADNVHLFNLLENKIEDTSTLVKRVTDHNSVRIGKWLDDESILIIIDYSNRGENNMLKSAGVDYFRLSF